MNPHGFKLDNEAAERDVDQFQNDLNNIKGLWVLKYSFLPMVLLIFLLAIQIVSIIFTFFVLQIISFVIAFVILTSYIVYRIVIHFIKKNIQNIKEKYRVKFYRIVTLKERTRLFRWNIGKVKKDLRAIKFELTKFDQSAWIGVETKRRAFSYTAPGDN